VDGVGDQLLAGAVLALMRMLARSRDALDQVEELRIFLLLPITFWNL
jgi:hypothetical protein